MQNTSESLARLRGVHRAFGSVKALAGIDLELRRGEVLALLGPNGAGKTTAISILLGLLDPEEGEVHLFGGSPRSKGARQRVGAMLQVSGLSPNLTVQEQVDLFRAYYPHPASVEDLVRTADLAEFWTRRASDLSGGQLQRLLFALALAGNPELLFLDEPSVGLDVESRRRLWSRVRELAEEDRTVLLTTHHLEEAAALADRIAVLDQGRVIAEGTPAELEALVSGRRIRCVTQLSQETLRSLAGVRRVERRGVATEIFTSDVESVLRLLLAQDPELHDLEVGGVGLEQAFLTLVGRDEALDSAPGNRRAA